MYNEIYWKIKLIHEIFFLLGKFRFGSKKCKNRNENDYLKWRNSKWKLVFCSFELSGGNERETKKSASGHFAKKFLKFFKIENPHFILCNAKTSPHHNKRKTLPTDQLNLAENFRVTYKSQSRMRTIRKSLLKPYIFQPTLAVFNPKKKRKKNAKIWITKENFPFSSE